MLVLGIDPGLAITGYALIGDEMDAPQLFAAGAIRTESKMPLTKRLLELRRQLSAVAGAHKPDAVAVEELFFGRNARTALAVGQARGVALLTCAELGVPIYQYKPAEVKEAVTGYGAAPKAQVQEMVRLLLHLPVPLEPDDVADAAAVALCHLRYGLALACGLMAERTI